MINSQLSSKDKTGLGYGDQLNENDSSGSELFNSVFDSRSSDGDDNQTNDRFKKDNGYHVIPPPLSGNYMSPLADLSFEGLIDSVYRPTANKTSAIVSQVKASITPPRNSSVEMPRVEFVRPSGVIIKDWVSDDEDIFQSNDLQATDKPSLKRIDYNHLIKECDFHEKKMAKKSVLKNMGKNILTRSGRVPVSATKQSSLKATASTSTFRPVNTATHTNRVNVSKLRAYAFHRSHSPIRRPFYKSTAPNTRISNKKVNTVRVNSVNIVGQTVVSNVKKTGFTAVKASAAPDFKLLDEGQVLLRVPKQSNMYNFDLKNVVASGEFLLMLIKLSAEADFNNRKPHYLSRPFPQLDNPNDQKLNDEEMAREEQERIDFKKALELQKQLDESEETNNIDWNTIRLFEPDKDDVLWKLQRYMYDPLTWRLYGTCGVHHVSSTRGHDIYMLIEKDYPLSTAVMNLMLSRRLQVEEDSEMAKDLIMKIFIEANKPRR
ncbi:hypothetical protein Tco_0388787 [Tanacetum coccineum]